MVHLALKPTEAEVQRMVLESYLSDLRMEIADTDSLDYREKLKAALPFLEQAGEMRPDDAQLWQNLGRLYANLNMVDKSRMAFDRADRLSRGK